MYLTKEAYNKHSNSFKILEINENDALNNNLDDLLKLIETQRRQVARKYHTDQERHRTDEQMAELNTEKMKEINIAKEKLDEFIIKDAQKTGSKYATSSPGSSSSRQHSYTYSGSKGFSFSFSSNNSEQSSYTFFSAGNSHSSHSSKENMDENHNSMHMNNSNIRRNYGSIHMNNGRIDENHGFIHTNNSNIRKNYALIHMNYGIIDENYGSIRMNNDTIKRDHNKEKSRPSHGASRGANIEMNGSGVFINGKRVQPGTTFSDVDGVFVFTSQSRKR
ncbi:hypothetical protein [Candidatus Mesenet endosymbiont of Agriotes lineatus]|uniref:hypothetical protein n=1 Tax=Candidatus Mesenet endosymbiont of Agriotes lineatus TaxID=3077948 RepID=UPI0030D4BCF4